MAEDSNGNLFAGIYTRGLIAGNASICKSTDGGASWSVVYYDSGARHVHCIAIDQSNDYIYASIGDERISPKWRTSVIRAIDGGVNNASWKRIFTLPQILAIEAVCTKDSSGNLISEARLFATDYDNGQIFRTKDDKMFSLVLDTGTQSYGYWMRRNDLNGHIYASFTGGEHPSGWLAGIWLSTDNGVHWSVYKTFPIHHPYYGSECASNFVAGTMYYCLQLDSGWQNGVKIYPDYSVSVMYGGFSPVMFLWQSTFSEVSLLVLGCVVVTVFVRRFLGVCYPKF